MFQLSNEMSDERQGGRRREDMRAALIKIQDGRSTRFALLQTPLTGTLGERQGEIRQGKCIKDVTGAYGVQEICGVRISDKVITVAVVLR